MLVGKYGKYKEGRDLLEVTREIDKCDLEKLSTTVDSRTIAILADTWWPQKANRKGKRYVD